MVKNPSFKIIWDVEALEHFKEIIEHLNKHSNQAPKIVKKAIFDTLKTIKENPLVCEKDKLKNPPSKDYRAFIVFSYRVTYQIQHQAKEVRILRLRHTSREPLGY
jgi:plasmid stabilization system protein ParE